MEKIHWGIIGCGDVTEHKSGPAFNKVPNSALVAVMRRNAAKAADYARRHHVPAWYSHTPDLIYDDRVNAIYIATPPASHEEYALAAIRAGKPVYLEKPMAITHAAAERIARAASEKNVKLVVAHYRRQWPLFAKLKQLVDEQTVGLIRYIRLVYDKPPLTAAELTQEKTAWRVNPAISGGGLFHDLAPHQLDILYYLFGPPQQVSGIAANQAGAYPAHDFVAGNMLFAGSIVFTGSWCFNAPASVDTCELVGEQGSIQFSFFSSNIIRIQTGLKKKQLYFDTLQHVQQPMIEKTVQYFLGQAENPCPATEGAAVMQMMEQFITG